MFKWLNKRLAIAATLLSTLMLTPVLSGCAAITAASSVGTVIDAVSGPVEIPMKVKKGYYVMLVGATGANHLAEAAVDTGFLQPGSARAVYVADRLADLKRIMDAARIAYHAADTQTLQEKVAAGNEIIAVLTPLITKP